MKQGKARQGNVCKQNPSFPHTADRGDNPFFSGAPIPLQQATCHDPTRTPYMQSKCPKTQNDDDYFSHLQSGLSTSPLHAQSPFPGQDPNIVHKPPHQILITTWSPLSQISQFLSYRLGRDLDLELVFAFGGLKPRKSQLWPFHPIIEG